MCIVSLTFRCLMLHSTSLDAVVHKSFLYMCAKCRNLEQLYLPINRRISKVRHTPDQVGMIFRTWPLTTISKMSSVERFARFGKAACAMNSCKYVI